MKIMKLLKYNKIAVLALVSITLFSCGSDDLPGESQLDFTQPEKTALDNWIDGIYLDQYNINVQYKWNQNTVDNSRYLFPPEIDKVKPALEIVQTIWLKSYARNWRSRFRKENSAKRNCFGWRS